MMMTERGMVAPAAGGSALAQFDDILAAAAAGLAGHVQAVGFDAGTGCLDVAPDAPAYGTKLRWSAPKLIAAANEMVRGANVRALHVAAPAPVKAGPATAAATPAPQPAVPATPVERRRPPEGYRRAIEAYRQSARPSLADLGIAEAVERQTAAMRELNRRALPEPDVVPDGGPASIEATRAQRCSGPSRCRRSTGCQAGGGQWTWQLIESVTVSEAPVKSTNGRRLARVFEAVWAPQSPHEMTVAIGTTDGIHAAVLVHSAAATAYTMREVALSHRLLSFFIEGRLTPQVLIDWLLGTRISRKPGPDAREFLLQRWTEIP
ncbi:hypothetical protein [Streptomyces sp. NPDC051132]|uniref:hypothetical protein n=1 Tax=unclassified Streptomyces TaxID=2593676 RepID=UPI003436EA77